MITKAMNAIDNVRTVQHARKVLLDFNSLATEMKMKTTFKTLLLKDVQYIPSKFEEDIIDTFLLGSRDRKTDKAEAIKFILEHNERLAEIHDLYLLLKLYGDSKKVEDYDGQIIGELLHLASIDSAKPYNLVELLTAMKNKLLITPRTLSFKDMFAIYIRNLPAKKVTTSTPTSTTSFSKIPELSVQGRCPWKSTKKIKHYGQFHNVNVTDDLIEHRKDSFNRYENIKKYSLMTVGPKDSLIIDYFFPGKFVYLLAIKINSRKAFAIPSDITTETSTGSWVIPNKGNKTIEATIKAMNKLKSMTNIKVITCDKEGAFTSSVFSDWCKSEGIKLHLYTKNVMKGVVDDSAASVSSRGNHSTIALIDRLTKTLRNMSAIAYGTQSINPHMMEALINEYNDSIHSTLSRILKRNVTPNEMEASQDLRNEFVRLVSRHNVIKTLAPDFDVKSKVYVMNEASSFDKLKPKLLPGMWHVIGRKGPSSFILRNEEGHEIVAPRWMLKTRL